MNNPRPSTTRKTHLTCASEAAITPHILNYWYTKYDLTFHTVADKIDEYYSNEILDAFGIPRPDTTVTVSHSSNAKTIMSTILDGMNLAVVETESGGDTFRKGLPIFSVNADIKPDMRPDVVICPADDSTIPIAVAEVISTDKTKEQGMYQASMYAMNMARLYAHFGIQHPGYCIVFPNSKREEEKEKDKQAAFGISIIKCQWVYESCHFLISAESLNRDQKTIKSRIKKVLPTRKKLSTLKSCFKNRQFEHYSKFIFKFNLQDANKFFRSNNYQVIKQFSSSHAIVLQVKQLDLEAEPEAQPELVIKVVSAAVHSRLMMLKDVNHLQSPYLVHHRSVVDLCENNLNCVAITFPYLVPPLTAEEARQCLKDYVSKIHDAIVSIHKERFHHGDIRLENICFVYNDKSGDYDVRLIDLEMGYVGEDAMGVKRYADKRKLSCLYRIPQPFGNVDYLQLGYMILWVTSNIDCDYHKLDDYKKDIKDPFLNDLLLRGVYDNIDRSTVFGNNEVELKTVIQNRERGRGRVAGKRKQAQPTSAAKANGRSDILAGKRKRVQPTSAAKGPYKKRRI